MQELESLITKFPREARLGGVPTTVSKIRAYVTLRASRKDIYKDVTVLQRLGDDYCWVIVFYLLRSGNVNEAVEYVTSNDAAFRAIDRNFPAYLTNYARAADRRLPRELQARIEAEYHQRTRVAPENSIDPYRIASYKIVGRCDLTKRHLEHIDQGVEDWMWLQFCLAREMNRVDEVATEVFGLDEVRVVIREIGQRHFGKGQTEATPPGGHGTFFFLQILGGLFEEAVAYLYPYSYVSAVHFAVALAFYGLLRVSDSLAPDSELREFNPSPTITLDCKETVNAEEIPVTLNTMQLPQITYGRMVGYYTRDFRSSDVEAAADYLMLIGFNADLPGAMGKSQAVLCHEALRELVLETREFAKLLGDVRSDGQRIKGAIERRTKLVKRSSNRHPTDDGDEEDLLATLTVQAATIAEDNGRTTDAVLLYHLADEYDRVVTVINRALSEAVSVEMGQQPIKLEPLKARSDQDNAPPSQSQQQQQSNRGPQTASLSLSSIDDPAELASNMINLYNSNALFYAKIKPANRDACGMLLRMSVARSYVEQGRWGEALDLIESLGILPLRARGQMAVIRLAAQNFNNQSSLSGFSSSSPSSFGGGGASTLNGSPSLGEGRNANRGNGLSSPSSPSSPRRSTSSSSRQSHSHSQSQLQSTQPQGQMQMPGQSKALNEAHTVLARAVGHLLTWTITCLANQRHLIRSSAFYRPPPQSRGGSGSGSGGAGMNRAGPGGAAGGGAGGEEAGGEAAGGDELAIKAKDLMVFAGLIRYHLPARVFETLARAGAEIDAW